MRGGETRRGSRGRKAALGRDNPVLFSLSLGLDHQQQHLLDEQLVKEQLVEEYLVNDLLEHQQRKVLVEDE